MVTLAKFNTPESLLNALQQLAGNVHAISNPSCSIASCCPLVICKAQWLVMALGILGSLFIPSIQTKKLPDW